jgi:hypothetical protein
LVPSEIVRNRHNEGSKCALATKSAQGLRQNQEGFLREILGDTGVLNDPGGSGLGCFPMISINFAPGVGIAGAQRRDDFAFFKVGMSETRPVNGELAHHDP